MAGAGRDREPEREHGRHTLRVQRGQVVGIAGDDVFVELGPRQQGVISLRAFEAPPAEGDEFEFTLRGQEEGLWVLQLAFEESLVRWESMELGSLVRARVVRRRPGGYELKIGPLHAFLPSSQSGVPPGGDKDAILGKELACEVIEIDPERQRVLVSRKAVLKRERAGRHARAVSELRPGQVVQGRVARVEDYGAFVRFGRGLQGLVHVSDLAHRRVEHPSEVVRVGQSVEAKVLFVRRGGRRIGLGLKQMLPSPWPGFARANEVGALVEGRVVRVLDYGAFVELLPGVEGLLHASECGLGPDETPRQRLSVGQRVAVRLLDVDPERERAALSRVHPDGRLVAAEEAQGAREFGARREELARPGAATHLGRLLRRALEPEDGRRSDAG